MCHRTRASTRRCVGRESDLQRHPSFTRSELRHDSGDNLATRRNRFHCQGVQAIASLQGVLTIHTAHGSWRTPRPPNEVRLCNPHPSQQVLLVDWKNAVITRTRHCGVRLSVKVGQHRRILEERPVRCAHHGLHGVDQRAELLEIESYVRPSTGIVTDGIRGETQCVLSDDTSETSRLEPAGASKFPSSSAC